MGISSYRFAWTVPPQESFQSPEVVTVYSNQGLNQMSQTYHRFYNSHLIRGQYQLTERPTLINNWEATYFDFDEENWSRSSMKRRHWELNCLFWMTVGLVHEKMI